MPKKPSELINGGGVLPSSPAQPASTPGGNGLSALLVVALACVLGYLTLTRIDWDGGDRKQDDHHEQKDDDHKKQDDKNQDDKKQSVAALPGYLHIVRERIDTVDANESVARVADFVAKQKQQQVELEWRDSDKDDPSEPVQKMVQHAKSKGIDPPFLLYKSKDGNQLRGVIKLPPSSATDAQILEVFKQ
jgi:hypothetical protein